MEDVRIVHTMGINNCGGKCIIHAHVRNGVIEKITTDTPEAQEFSMASNAAMPLREAP